MLRRLLLCPPVRGKGRTIGGCVKKSKAKKWKARQSLRPALRCSSSDVSYVCHGTHWVMFTPRSAIFRAYLKEGLLERLYHISQ